MAPPVSLNSQELLDAINRLITKHSVTHPDLTGELLAIRDHLIDSKDLATAALQLAAWVKFIFDTL